MAELLGVLDEPGHPLPGLYVRGEMLGDLFAGAVFGRRAGTHA